ncbi:hypothetical protein BI198_15705 [Rheinheimera salexigens]|uniref:Multidrug resistance protein MdtA-like barrel-sandwich hybrid domain-containing protein n=2 Tax=Rheinheimera salexigens TaxID=1628148 RepID=A0A1E7QAD8_9GAMM|nr:hypothetical protein BI198_15705 [Rheinheimera salexigens]
MKQTTLAWVLLPALMLSACSEPESLSEANTPYVKAYELTTTSTDIFSVSGVVRAETETALAFQVSGQITTRHVNSGQQVKQDDVLFTLDSRDLQQQYQAVTAEHKAAESALAIAEADVKRQTELFTASISSAFAKERAELQLAEAQSRLDLSAARLSQAKNALGYAELKAPAAGQVLSLIAEAGQVVAVAQPVLRFAYAGAREVEVFFPEQLTPPKAGKLLLADSSLTLSFREADGEVQQEGRVLRARYRIKDAPEPLRLGSIVRAVFSVNSQQDSQFQVPLGALSERGTQAQVWQIADDKVQPVAVQIVSMSEEYALIRAELAPGDLIVATGTHLLKADMAVQVKK